MSAFRTCRPLLVDANQASEPSTIATDLGFVNVKRGEWIVRGEDGETYVVDDAFSSALSSPSKNIPGRKQKRRAVTGADSSPRTITLNVRPTRNVSAGEKACPNSLK